MHRKKQLLNIILLKTNSVSGTMFVYFLKLLCEMRIAIISILLMNKVRLQRP